MEQAATVIKTTTLGVDCGSITISIAKLRSLNQRWGGGESIYGGVVAGGDRTATNSPSENYRITTVLGKKVGEEEWQFRKYKLTRHRFELKNNINPK